MERRRAWGARSVLVIAATLASLSPPPAGAEELPQRTVTVTRGGKPVTLLGSELKIGDRAPEFVVMSNEFKPVTLKDYTGKIKVISSISSLDTNLCSTETKHFNELAAQMGEDVVVLTISMDLPYAQRRWCGSNGIDRVVALSDYKEHSFGKRYGLITNDLLLLARAVLIVDQQDVVRYLQLVPEIRQEPNYDDVLKALGEIKGGGKG